MENSTCHVPSRKPQVELPIKVSEISSRKGHVSIWKVGLLCFCPNYSSRQNVLEAKNYGFEPKHISIQPTFKILRSWPLLSTASLQDPRHSPLPNRSPCGWSLKTSLLVLSCAGLLQWTSEWVVRLCFLGLGSLKEKLFQERGQSGCLKKLGCHGDKIRLCHFEN